MAKKKSKGSKKSDSTLFAFIATFFSIIGFIIAIIIKRDDKYVMHYAKMSLVIFIACIVLEILSIPISLLPVMGDIIEAILSLTILVFWLFSWIYALSGEMKDLRYVSTLADKLPF